MKIEVVMPQMGESIAEGTIAGWLKNAGDRVERDEPLLEVTTDKIDSEIPAPKAGILKEIKVTEGTTVSVGTVLAIIETASAEAGLPEGTAEPPVEEKAEKIERPVKQETAGPVPAVSPVARTVAEREGLSEAEIRRIDGSGHAGRVTKGDVLAYLKQKEGRPGAPEAARAVPKPAADDDKSRVEIIEMSTMRRKIAEHMVMSKHVSPHTYTVAEVDLTRIVNFRERVKDDFERREGFKLTYTHFILHATVKALQAHPLVNASVEEGRIIRKKYINLGVAVALDDGLIVPVIKNADEKNLLGLARAASALAVKARTRKLVPEDVQGGTFTVTNPGVFGNIFGLPIINQPQLGILGVGAVKKRPVVIDDAIAIRSMMYLSLSYDHRAVDGMLAARFVQEIRQLLEEYDLDNPF